MRYIISVLAIGLGIVLIVDNYSIGLKILNVALAGLNISKTSKFCYIK